MTSDNDRGGKTSGRRDLTPQQRSVLRYCGLALNVFVLFVGIATICVACYVYTRMSPEAIAGYALLVPLKEVFIVGVVLGCVIVLFSVLGIAGVLFRRKFPLKLFAAVLLLCLVGHLVIASAAYVQNWIRPDGKIMLKSVTSETWDKLAEDQKAKVQFGLKCCGFDNPNDRSATSPNCPVPGAWSPRPKAGCWEVASASVIPSSTLVYKFLFAVAALEFLAFVACALSILFPPLHEDDGQALDVRFSTAISDFTSGDDEFSEFEAGDVEPKEKNERLSAVPGEL